jgi:FKBP-type peptidyl-prolyl cis-trans isomerase
MSVAEAANRPSHRGGALKLWLGFLLLIGAGVGLAWWSASRLRPEITSSGLEFRTVKEGAGPSIGDADAALMDYVGSFDDGTVFDSSEAQGGAQPFTTAQVFPGFAEAMRRMREGGQYRFTMPQRLAFGANPRPPGFPADSDLTFDVRVRKVVPGGAAMVQQAGPPR